MLNGNTYKSSGWIKDSAINHQIGMIKEELIGDYIVAAYSCQRIIDGWDCHGGWQVEGFSIELGIPDTPGAIGVEADTPDCPLPSDDFTVESSFRETFGCVYEGLEWQGAGLIANQFVRTAFCELLGGTHYRPVGSVTIPTTGTVTLYSLGGFYHQELESTSIMSKVGCANV